MANWASGDPTHYKILVSPDFSAWTTYADASSQSAPSVATGYIHGPNRSLLKGHFLPVRYVRMVTLGGQLYPNTMTRIVQIRVFGN